MENNEEVIRKETVPDGMNYTHYYVVKGEYKRHKYTLGHEENYQHGFAFDEVSYKVEFLSDIINAKSKRLDTLNEVTTITEMYRKWFKEKVDEEENK